MPDVEVLRSLSAVPVGDVVPSKKNPRFMRDNDIAELTKNIAQVGILEPLVGRPLFDSANKIEICCGHRRLQAAIDAHLSHVPVMVCEMDDKAFAEAMAIENMHRRNLHPLEEARGIQMMLDEGCELDEIAADLAKEKKWIVRRAQLTKLSPKWQKAIETDEHFRGLSAGHLELIARLPSAQQDKHIESFEQRHAGHFMEILTIQGLRSEIAEDSTLLSAMPWKLDDAALDPKAGACNVCPKRSSAAPLLFDAEDEKDERGKVQKGDRCLDKVCFDRKIVAFTKLTVSALKKDHKKVLVLVGDNTPDEVKKSFAAIAMDHYRASSISKTDPRAVPAVDLSDGRFRTVWVNPSGCGGAQSRSPSSPTPKAGPLPMKEKVKRLEDRRHHWFADQVRERLEKLKIEKVWSTGPQETEQLVALLAAFGTDDNAGDLGSFAAVAGASGLLKGPRTDPWDYFDRVIAGKIPTDVAILDLLKSIREVWTRRLGNQYANPKDRAKDAERISQIVGIDWVALQADARKEIPTPKSWAAEKAASKKKTPAKVGKVKTKKKPA